MNAAAPDARGQSTPRRAAAAGRSHLARERRTVQAMVDIYCRGNHAPSKGRCGDCERLGAYADARLERCPFGDEKPTCAECPIHCYQPAMRQAMKGVMRYAGPRMSWRHPILALWHWIDGWRRSPASPRRAAQG